MGYEACLIIRMASFAVALIGLLAQVSEISALAAQSNVRPTPKLAYDTVGGSCEDFNTHVRDRGLKDSEGNTHVSTLGFTSCSFSAPSGKHDIKFGAVPGTKKFCASIDLSGLRFASDEIITIMRWDPGQATISKECREDLARLEASIKSHEAAHVADCRVILAEANKVWASTRRVVEVCNETGRPLPPKELVARLQSRAQSEIADQLRRMTREMEYKSRETHERIGYGTTALNCSKCGSLD